MSDSESDWLDIFVGVFVLLALVMMTIKAWIRVVSTAAAKSSEGDPTNPSLLPYIAGAIFISALSLIILVSIHNLTSVNLQLPGR